MFVEPTSQRLRTDIDEVAMWFCEHRPVIDSLCTEVGAIVLRGFAVGETRAFGALVETYPAPEFGYTAGATPRRNIEGRVFEATNAPADFKIHLHQEMAYLPKFPTRLAFYCQRPPDLGGETIIGDMRRFEAGIRPGFRQKVAEVGVRYERNFRSPEWSAGHPVLDARHLPWTEAFGTSDRCAAERACDAMGLEHEWVGDSLSTSYRAEGTARHPDTNETIWFNQLIHQRQSVPSVGRAVFEAYAAHYEPGRPQPYSTRFGDGSEVDDDDITAAFDVLEDVTVAFSWQHGDVMIVDNLYTAHGRNTFVGTRDVQVALLGEGHR